MRILLVLLLLSITANAATVTGTAKLPNGNPFVGAFKLTPLSTPMYSSGNVVTGPDLFINTATNGTFTTTLQPGNYRVTLNQKTWTIGVPDSTNSFDWTALVTGGLNAYIIPQPITSLPTTTKGDLIVHDGTNNARQAVGSNGQVLTADSTKTNGVTWSSIAGALADEININWTNVASVATFNSTNPAAPAGTVLVVPQLASDETNITFYVPANSSSSAGVVATGSGQASKVWKTDAGGEPGWRDDATGLTEAQASLLYQKTNDTLTVLGGIGLGTAGDVIYRDASRWTNLAKGSDGQVLKLSSGYPAWSADATGGSPSFDTITSGENATASMRVGTGGYLSYTNSGVVNANQFLGVTTVDASEFGYINGVTSAIQTQINNQLTEAEASALYQATNAVLTTLGGIGAGSSGQVIWHDGTRWTNSAANAFQATNANLTALQAYTPATWQATNATLTIFAGIGLGTSGDVLFRDASRWTNLAKGSDGQVLKLSSGLPSWQADSTGGSPSFDTISGGANTSAGMRVDTGAHLSYTNSGIVNANQFLGVTTVDSSEFGYLNGVTSAIQTQLDGNKLGAGTNIVFTVVGGNTNINVSPEFDTLYVDSISTTTPLALAYGGTAAALADPDANRYLGWDDTDGAVKMLVYGTGLSYDAGTDTLSVTGFQAADADLTTWAGITPGANVGTFLATPSSANFASAVTGETGSGAVVFGTLPSFTQGDTAGGAVYFTEDTDNGNNKVTLKAADSLAGDYTVTLPSVTGTLLTTRVGVLRNVWIPASAMNPPASGAPSFRTNTWATTTDAQTIEVYDFDDATDESLQFTLMMPEAWDGADPKFKFVWKPVAELDAYTNIWGVVGGSINNDEDGGNTLGTAATVEDVGLTSTNKVHISPAVTCDIGGSPAAGHFIWFKVYRDANAALDELAGDASLIGVYMQYQETTTEPSAW